MTALEHALLTTVLQGQQRVVLRQWFRGRHIQSSSCNPTAGQGLVQVVLVHHISPGNGSAGVGALKLQHQGCL